MVAFSHVCCIVLRVCIMVGKSQIPLCYLVADRFEAGRGPVADLLARASSLLAS